MRLHSKHFFESILDSRGMCVISPFFIIISDSAICSLINANKGRQFEYGYSISSKSIQAKRKDDKVICVLQSVQTIKRS